LAGIAAFTLALSFFAARIMTRPISRIHALVDEFAGNIDPLREIPNAGAGITEFSALFDALVEMRKKTLASMEREVALRNQEMQTRMLALQSQMNPHFLYNSLAAIQSMADDGMSGEIVDMCQTISRILRYISSNKVLLAPLREDLQNMVCYLECMKTRYDGDLEFNVDVPPEMLEMSVPKLSLQLIAENSIKFMTKSAKPPWLIEAKGRMENGRWEIQIRDNGKGFSPESLEDLKEKIKLIDQTGLLPELELHGLGLLNIYIRLKLLGEGRFTFSAGNHEGGGAIVSIGGEPDARERVHGAGGGGREAFGEEHSQEH
jgi:sensor histidine kinase YesM